MFCFCRISNPPKRRECGRFQICQNKVDFGPAVVLSLSDFKSSSTLGMRQITNLSEQSSFRSAGFAIRQLFCLCRISNPPKRRECGRFQICQNKVDFGPAVVLSLSDFKSSSTLGMRQITNLSEQSSFRSAGFAIRQLFCLCRISNPPKRRECGRFHICQNKVDFGSAGFAIRLLFYYGQSTMVIFNRPLPPA